MDEDDIRGKCGVDADTWDDFKVADGVVLNIPKRNESTFPLLKTINEAITLTLDEMQQQTNLMNNTNVSHLSRIVNVPLLVGGIVMTFLAFRTKFLVITILELQLQLQ